MFPLTLGRPRVTRLQVLCIGAHCDDIEIGCGGTLLDLQRRQPGCVIHWLVLTSVPARHDEAQQAMQAFVHEASRGTVHVGSLPDGLLPSRLADVKAQFEAVKRDLEPDLVLTHHGRDRHQDHALVSEVTWQTFRDHTIWEYEIPKYDGDLTTPNLYVPLTEAETDRKVDIIMNTFLSQRSKSWFRGENLLALMRLRGLECRAPSGLAEGFHARKLVFSAEPVGQSS